MKRITWSVTSSDSARSDDLAAARFRAAATAADALTGAALAADLLVVLEDLQWADHASLFLLRELAAELPGSRLLLLATCRDTAGDPWRTSMADLARLPGVQILRLAPLSETAVAGLLRTAGVTTDPELARFVHARSEGNALYVTTLARVLAAQPGAAADADAVARIAAGSAEMSHLVASLLRDLDDGACALLAAASVLGADFNSGLAAAVAGMSQDPAGRAVGRGDLRAGHAAAGPPRILAVHATPWSATASTRVSARTSESRCTPPRPPRWSHWPSKLRNGAVRSPGTCSGRHRTRAHSGRRPTGPRRRRRPRRQHSRSRTQSGTWPSR